MNKHLRLAAALGVVLVLTAVAACGPGSGSPAGPTPVTSSLTLFDATGTSRLADGTIGLACMTSSVHAWSTTITVPSSEASDALDSLQLTVVTGGDDLRGGNQPSDNANVTLQFASGEVTFTNVNQSQHWNNNETHMVTLAPIPPRLLHSANYKVLLSLPISLAA